MRALHRTFEMLHIMMCGQSNCEWNSYKQVPALAPVEAEEVHTLEIIHCGLLSMPC